MEFYNEQENHCAAALNGRYVEYFTVLVVELGVHDMQQASCKAEPGDYKHAVNDLPN